MSENENEHQELRSPDNQGMNQEPSNEEALSAIASTPIGEDEELIQDDAVQTEALPDIDSEEVSEETEQDDTVATVEVTSEEPEHEEAVAITESESEEPEQEEAAALVEPEPEEPEQEEAAALVEPEPEEPEQEEAAALVEPEPEEPEQEEAAALVEPEPEEPEQEEAVALVEPEPEEAEQDEIEDAVVEDVQAPKDEPDDGRLWYVVHCYSGYENKVRHNLEQRIETMGMKDKIFDVVVPTEEEIEIKEGKRRTIERRVFPGYILVQMIMDEDSWYVVRNTPGVTGFVGMGNDPTPLRPEEVSSIVKRMEAEAPRIKVTFSAGQKVRIIDGPFNDFIGTVSDIDMERAKVRVMVSFFGRETPVELDFLQVEKA
jgi:transcriptional antiterminator NusG